MTSIAMECSTSVGSVASRGPSGELREARFDGRTHARGLLVELDRLLRAEAELRSAIERVIVGTGPGSYTGLRVAIATGLGLARGSGASLYALSSYEALAWGELAPGEEGCVLADARAGKLYFARYLRTPTDVLVPDPPRLIDREEAGLLCGASARLFCELALAESLHLGARSPAPIVPYAQALLELAERRIESGALSACTEVEPLYLRPVQAIERRR